jgi:uncharacterized protein YqgC (DUF456 family)
LVSVWALALALVSVWALALASACLPAVPALALVWACRLSVQESV